MKRTKSAIGVVLALALFQLALGRAADADVGQDDADASEVTSGASAVSAKPAATEWEFLVTGYLFASAVNGDISAKGVTADFDVSFIDIMKKFDLGGMGAVEVRRGPWRLVANAMGLKVSDDFDTRSVTVGAGPTTLRKGPLKFGIPRVQTSVGPAEVDVKSSMVFAELLLAYRALSMPLSEVFGDAVTDDARRFDLDLFAGGRWYWIDSEIKVKIPPVKVPGFDISITNARNPLLPRRQPVQFRGLSVPGVSFGGLDDKFDESTWWVDPIVGFRARTGLSERLALTLIGDIGGFGIGSASNFVWEAWGILNYRLNDSWTLLAGYRAIDIDRDFGSAGFDGTLYGPTLGVQYRF